MGELDCASEIHGDMGGEHTSSTRGCNSWQASVVVATLVLATAAVAAVAAGGGGNGLQVLGESTSAFGYSPGAQTKETARSLQRLAVLEATSLAGEMLDEDDINATDGNSTQVVSEMAGFTLGENGTCLHPPLLHAYFVNQLFWTWVHTLEVSGVIVDAEGKQVTIPLGHVKSAPFSFLSEQTWTDEKGDVITSSHQDAISTVTNIYVHDCNGKALATVSEQLAPSSSAVSQYTIQNTDGDIIAISTMSRNFGTEVDINDQQTGKRVVTVSKGWEEFTDAWSATFREGQEQTLANEPRVLVMLLSAASSAGSWGLGGPLAIMLNPLWLLLLFCCCCAGFSAWARAREAEYEEVPNASYGGPFFGQGYTTGYGTGGGTFGGTQYV